ncbi:MAG: HlyD family efflux transporter periplasmic adaptor subunit [Lachnospiraceae bacterium]|nr:HlyD family efflux transporter periplasmic adaptor subunit [Lachnospiraceae bacterium]MDD7702062.1 HlyD family efflux transporter periplasmic adaptor subunit [Lachnospiraceae bacterium]
MDEFRKRQRKKKMRIGIALVLVIVILVGAIYIKRSKKESVDAEVKTEKLEKRTIVNSVSGSGKVEAVNSEEVTAGMAGTTIDSIEVQVGDHVEAGQTIAVMDTSSLSSQVKSLNDEIKDLEKQKADAEKSKKEAEDKAAADAQAAQVQAAQDAYAREVAAQAQKEANEAEKKQTLSALTAQYNALNTQYTADNEKLQSMQATYQEKLQDGADDGADAGADGKKGWKETDADAMAYYALILQQQGTVTTELAQLQNLQTSMKAVENADTSVSIPAVSSPQLSLPATGQLNNMNVATSYDSAISTLKEQVKSLNRQIANGTIKARTSGTVTEVNAKAGDTYLGTPIASVEGIETLMLTAEVDEYDIPDVSVGMPVKIKTDATRDEELEGEVSFVALKASGSSSSSSLGAMSSLTGGADMSGFTAASSDATYTVHIALKEQNERLRIGMNAKISIITDSVKDAWSVPFESVQTDEDGREYIEVEEEKKVDGRKTTTKRKIPVITGIEGTYYIQIMSDELKEGMDVIVPESQDNSMEELMNMMGSDAGI